MGVSEPDDTAGVDPDADDPMTLADMIVHLEHVIEDIDLMDEQVTLARHRAGDDGVRLELHAIGDDLTKAWAHTRMATQGLRLILTRLIVP